MIKRLAVLTSALVLFVLLSEGLLSLLFDQSWSRLVRGRSFLEAVAEPLVQTDSDRFAAAAGTPGPYRIHADPRVGYVMKSEAELELMRATVHTDALGLRARPAGEVGPDAFHLVVLGDSVAFGWGLEDDQVFGVRLEQALAAVRAPGEPEIACRTVAIPSWNTKNAARFLLDHLDELQPDLVLYMHVPNDVNDCFGVYETGHRRAQPDLCSPDPLVHVTENMPYVRRIVQRLMREGVDLGGVDAGLEVLPAGLSPTSSARIREMADVLDGLRLRLAEVDSPLVLLPYKQFPLHRQLRLELERRATPLPSIPLLEELLDGDTLGYDPHPAADTVQALALWTASSLVEAGLVPRSGTEGLPPLPDAFVNRRGREFTVEELQSWSTEFERESRAALVPTIEHASGRGVLQIYGGIRLDGSLGPALVALLPTGRELRVELAPREDALLLYPVEVRVDVNGVAVGSLRIDGTEPSVVGEFALEPNGSPIEVRLEADRWELLPVLGRARLVSARFVSLGVRD